MKTRLTIIIWLLFLAITHTFAQNSATLSLHQLLDSALQNNYLLLVNEKNTLIKQTDIDILNTNYQPTISTSASFSYWKFLLPNKQRLLGNALTDMYTDVSIYQTIYDWGENKAKKAVVEKEIELNDEIRRQIKNTIIWGVSDAFFEAMKAESEITAHRNSLEQLEAHLKYTQNLYNIGKVSEVDVLKINVQISVEEKNLNKAINEYEKQRLIIKRLCYLEEERELIIQNNSELLFEQYENRMFDHQSIYQEVYQNHPAIIQADQNIGIEINQRELYELQNRPELFSYGIGSWEHGYIPFGNNFNYNIGIGITYTLPYWGGSSFKSQKAQAQYRIEQLGDEKNQTFIDIKKDIDLTLNSIIDTKSEIRNNKKIIDLADKTIKNAMVLYLAGQGNIIDVLDAQSILTEAIIEYRKSTIFYLQALAKLNYITGTVDYPFSI